MTAHPTTAPVRLPDLPKGKEFEEFLAAYFQAHGFYVERSVVDRQEEEVLEVDFITTRYLSSGAPPMRLYEVKSGGWGFGDIFKIRGWLDYIEIEDGVLLVQVPPKNPGSFDKVSSKLGIRLVAIQDLANAGEALRELIEPEQTQPYDIDAWRFSYWVERDLLARLKKKKKCSPGRTGFAALDEYAFTITSRAFFTTNVVDRASQLYDAFQSHPRISAKLSQESAGNSFADDHTQLSAEDFRRTYYDCELTDVAVSTFVEHRARLSLLKSLVDYELLRRDGDDHNKTFSLFDGTQTPFGTLDFLPASFQHALRGMSQDAYFHRYPVFWQWFLWLFGGFILKDYESQERELLAAKTGVPEGEIDRAFACYETLFPTPGGWFVDLPNTQIRCLKLFCTPFMGIGANFRRWTYCPTSSFDELALTGTFTRSKLLAWNNVAVALLRAG